MNINKQELINKIHTIDGLSADEKVSACGTT